MNDSQTEFAWTFWKGIPSEQRNNHQREQTMV